MRPRLWMSLLLEEDEHKQETTVFLHVQKHPNKTIASNNSLQLPNALLKNVFRLECASSTSQSEKTNSFIFLIATPFPLNVPLKTTPKLPSQISSSTSSKSILVECSVSPRISKKTCPRVFVCLMSTYLMPICSLILQLHKGVSVRTNSHTCPLDNCNIW